MESFKVEWSLLGFKEQANWISKSPPTYQREKGGIWKLPAEQLLIDSVLRNIDIPKIYLRRVSKDPLLYEVVDGQQRMDALLRFMGDAFALDREADPLHFDGHLYPLANKKYSELAAVQKQLVQFSDFGYCSRPCQTNAWKRRYERSFAECGGCSMSVPAGCGPRLRPRPWGAVVRHSWRKQPACRAARSITGCGN